MGQLSGILGAADNTLLTQIQPTTVTDAANELLTSYNTERQAAFQFFVEEETTDWKTIYLLGGGDEMQELGPHGQPVEERVTGKWEVSYPIKRYGSALGYDFETIQYMTLGDLQRQLNGKVIGNAKTHRRQIMRALFGNANYTWVDEQNHHGSLTIRRLANGDGTTYPPTVNSDSDADDNHYLVSEYAASAISDTNNPLQTLRDDLAEHFDGPHTVVALINSAQRKQVQVGLTQFVDAAIPGIKPGDNSAIVTNVPNAPGEFIGIDGASGVFVFVYDRVPANYIFTRDLTQPPPLKRRVHIPPALQGFKLEAEEENDPLYKRVWRDRFGYAAGNRLNGAIMFLDPGASYIVPTVYA